MVAINWTTSNLRPDGIYDAVVKRADEMMGKNGPFFAVSFHCPETGDYLAKDILSFSERAYGMTKRRLRALGFTEADTDIEAPDLFNRRVRLALVRGVDERSGDDCLVININASGSQCGYYPVEQPAPEESEEVAPVKVPPPDFDDDIPF